MGGPKRRDGPNNKIDNPFSSDRLGRIREKRMMWQRVLILILLALVFMALAIVIHNCIEEYDNCVEAHGDENMCFQEVAN